MTETDLDPPFDPSTPEPDPDPDPFGDQDHVVLIARNPKTGRFFWYRSDPRSLDTLAFRRVLIGQPYTISSEDSRLYLGGSTQGFEPEAVLIAARIGWFGFRSLDATERKPKPSPKKPEEPMTRTHTER